MSRTVPINEVADINPSVPKEISQQGDLLVAFVPMAGVSESGQLVVSEERALRDVLKGYRYFEKGDVLLAKITPCMENGKACFVDDAMPFKVGFGSTEFHVLRPGPDVDGRYLFYTIWNPGFRYVAERNMTGTAGQKRVPTDFLKRFQIPLPPIPEQRRIAAILDKAYAVRRKRQKAIKLTEEFLRSVFLDMFGDPVTNPKGWEVRRLGELLSFLTSGSRGWAKYYSNQGSLFLRIQNVGANKLILDDVAFVDPPQTAEAKRTLVKPGDVLLSITADLGRTGVVPDCVGPAHINQHLAILRVKGIEPIFLSAFLSSAGGQIQFAALNREGVKAGLNFDDIRSVKILCPPDDIQRRFVALYNKHTKHMTTLGEASVSSSDLFDSLISRLFSGRARGMSIRKVHS